MTRVVQVGFHLDRAGRDPAALLEAWPTLPGVASAVARQSVEVAVVQPADREARLTRDGVTYRFVAERPALLRRGTPGSRPVRAPPAAVVNAVARLAPDVIHVNGLSLPGHSRVLKKRLPRTPILAQDHADRPPSIWRRSAARRAMRAWDAVAFTAAAQAEPFLEAGLLRDLPIHAVPESSTDFTPGDPDRARQVTGLHGDPCLVWVGHLNGNKDPVTVLEGLATAARELPDPHLWCCYGDAPLLSDVEAAVAGHEELAGRVHLLGPLPHDRVELLLRAADALVLGSHREGSGYAVIEALACGTTPVVTAIPSFRQLAGDVGVLWSPGDRASFREALLLFARHRATRDRVRQHFEERLSWAAVGTRLAGIYRALADGSVREAR